MKLYKKILCIIIMLSIMLVNSVSLAEFVNLYAGMETHDIIVELLEYYRGLSSTLSDTEKIGLLTKKIREVCGDDVTKIEELKGDYSTDAGDWPGAVHPDQVTQSQHYSAIDQALKDIAAGKPIEDTEIITDDEHQEEYKEIVTKVDNYLKTDLDSLSADELETLVVELKALDERISALANKDADMETKARQLSTLYKQAIDKSLSEGVDLDDEYLNYKTEADHIDEEDENSQQGQHGVLGVYNPSRNT